MTTPNQNPQQAWEPSGSSTGPFDTAFGLVDTSQLVVATITPAGVRTQLTLTTDYTASAIGGDMLAAGARITLNAGAVPDGGWGGGKLTAERVTLTEQPVDFDDDDGFQPEDTEVIADRLTRIVQEIKATLARAVTVNIGDTPLSVEELTTLITNTVVQILEGEGLDAAVIAAVLANLNQIIALAGTELQALINQLEAAALALVPIVYATDVGEVNDIQLVLDPAPVEADLDEGFTTIVKMANANTGATTITVNDFGPFVLKFASGDALTSGTLKAGGSYLMAMVSDTVFQVVGLNKPAALTPDDVDFGLEYEHGTARVTVVKLPATGGKQMIMMWGTVNIATDNQATVTLPHALSDSNHRHVMAGSNTAGLPGPGVRTGEAASYFVDSTHIKVGNDNETCDVSWFASGLVDA